MHIIIALIALLAGAAAPAPVVQYVGVGFEAGSTLPSTFADEAARRVEELRTYQRLQALSISGLAIRNDDGAMVVGDYTKASGHIRISYGQAFRGPSRIELGAHRTTVGSTAIDAFTHEVGHHVYFTILTNAERAEWARLYRPNVFEAAVSRYAGRDAVEGFAEAFSAYVSHARLPRNIDTYFNHQLN